MSGSGTCTLSRPEKQESKRVAPRGAEIQTCDTHPDEQNYHHTHLDVCDATHITCHFAATGNRVTRATPFPVKAVLFSVGTLQATFPFGENANVMCWATPFPVKAVLFSVGTFRPPSHLERTRMEAASDVGAVVVVLAAKVQQHHVAVTHLAVCGEGVELWRCEGER
eukprot:366236-Chlamydomonas_euryale.AAC.8